jgi:hypothetical protein
VQGQRFETVLRLGRVCSATAPKSNSPECYRSCHRSQTSTYGAAIIAAMEIHSPLGACPLMTPIVTPNNDYADAGTSCIYARIARVA